MLDPFPRNCPWEEPDKLRVMVWLRKALHADDQAEFILCAESHVMTPHVRQWHTSVSLWATPNTTNPQQDQNIMSPALNICAIKSMHRRLCCPSFLGPTTHMTLVTYSLALPREC